MQILWHGQSCFQIITPRNKGEQTKIIIDPFSEEIGWKLPKLEADILLVTHEHSDHNFAKGVGGDYFLISGPGEYEVKGAYIQGIPAFHDEKEGKERGLTTIYTIETEELKLCHLGDFCQKELTEEQSDKIGEVDILMIPVGGVYTLDAKTALKVMSQIEPKITIPMHYQLPKLKAKLDGLDKFLKTVGLKSAAPEAKLSIKKKNISLEEAKIIILKPWSF